jgi:hypothetical protein
MYIFLVKDVQRFRLVLRGTSYSAYMQDDQMRLCKKRPNFIYVVQAVFVKN